MSGIFFGGVPGQILEAWRDGHFVLVFSPSVFEEGRRVAHVLNDRYPGIDVESFLQLLLVEGRLTSELELPEPICADPDDDKFIACAVASEAALVVSGDQHVLDVTGYLGVRVVTPRQFVDGQLPR